MEQVAGFEPTTFGLQHPTLYQSELHPLISFLLTSRETGVSALVPPGYFDNDLNRCAVRLNERVLIALLSNIAPGGYRPLGRSVYSCSPRIFLNQVRKSIASVARLAPVHFRRSIPIE